MLPPFGPRSSIAPAGAKKKAPQNFAAASAAKNHENKPYFKLDNVQTNIFPNGLLNRPRSDLQSNVASTPQVNS